ncbi:hypothetical protein [Sorangium sp. So ce385]|uniref:hypothetical protein n=1 Tax=Sorangium sp. So ce385 TaxID=3133308 RepID=UPI003F5C5682
MARINWLHVSDLRMGSGQSTMLFHPDVRDGLERDLRQLHAEAGPWDALILTGNLTENGLPREFERVDAFLDSMLAYLAELGSTPVVLAVPGGQDASWPRSDELATAWRDPAARALLRAPRGGSPHAGRPFWEGLASAFEPFSEWQRRRCPERWAGPVPLVPGDFVHVIEKDGCRLGVLGLNSAYAHFGASDHAGFLDVDTRFAR